MGTVEPDRDQPEVFPEAPSRVGLFDVAAQGDACLLGLRYQLPDKNAADASALIRREKRNIDDEDFPV